MVVPLLGRGIEFPRGTAEGGSPVIWGLAGSFAVAPDVPVTVLRGARGLRVLEPLVLVGSMVDHEIENHPNATLPGGGYEGVKICHGAVHGIDRLVV